MRTKVGINGFGRIGREVSFASLRRADIAILEIPDITEAMTLAPLPKYDLREQLDWVVIGREDHAMPVGGHSFASKPDSSLSGRASRDRHDKRGETSMTKTTLVKAFLATPSDLEDERRIFPEIIEEFNDIKANALGFHIKPVGWENTRPTWGRPQEVINKEVMACDLFVMALWTKWGTPTGRFKSGTEEEFHIAYQRHRESGGPDILLYFRSAEQHLLNDPGPQLQQIIEFKKKIENEDLCFFKTYETTAEWKSLLFKHLAQWLDERTTVTRVKRRSGQSRPVGRAPKRQLRVLVD